MTPDEDRAAYEGRVGADRMALGLAIIPDTLRGDMDEVKRLLLGYERYETARRMNPQQWADAWKLNISTGKAFDEIIDDLRPFVRTEIVVAGKGKGAR